MCGPSRSEIRTHTEELFLLQTTRERREARALRRVEIHTQLAESAKVVPATKQEQ